MKLVHISDIHIHNRPILNSDPIALFDLCLDHVKRHHSDAGRIVISGDLTHHGLEENYITLKDKLAAFGLPVQLMIGNHDTRETFQAVFPDCPQDPNGFVQYTDDTPAGRFIYLDTVEAGTHAGHLCENRLYWLRTELSRAQSDGFPVYLFMHHNPCPVGVPTADSIGLQDHHVFAKVLNEFKDGIRHIFFGHCHYTLSGSVSGVPMSAPRSTNHPCAPEMGRNAVGYGAMAPTYSVALLDEDHVVVHSMEFTLENQLSWMEVDDSGWSDDDG